MHHAKWDHTSANLQRALKQYYNYYYLYSDMEHRKGKLTAQKLVGQFF